jgi:hypothetical protein
MMRDAETSTGTPCNTSRIWSPELTSFTDNASSAYLRGHIHCSHRSTCGIVSRWTKKPAKVIWYKPIIALRRIARPPSDMAEPRRKFFARKPCEPKEKKSRGRGRGRPYEECHAYGIKYKDE